MAKRESGLGRGLDALFGDFESKVPVAKSSGTGKGTAAKRPVKEQPGQEFVDFYVDIGDIKPNAKQPRQHFDQDSIEELASSIEAHGVIEPVILRKAKTGYELVAGERRWRAARMAGLKEIPARVRDITDDDVALIAIIENVQREDLNPIEEATGYQTVLQRGGMTQESLARIVGKSRSHVANTLRTLGMQEEVVEMIRRGDLTLGHANALGAVKDAKKQLALAKSIVKKGLTVREAERLAAPEGKKPERKGGQKAKSDEIRGVEQELTSATGIRVRINGDGEKGNVELRYLDREGLEEIIELLRSARS